MNWWDRGDDVEDCWMRHSHLFFDTAGSWDIAGLLLRQVEPMMPFDRCSERSVDSLLEEGNHAWSGSLVQLT